jgi:hypothetical protein
MRYADTLLTEGETVILRTRQHWLALLTRARSALLVWLLAVLLIVAVTSLRELQSQPIRDIVGAVIVALLVLGLMIFVYRLWHWWAQDYIVTNRRLLKVTGILNKRSADSSLEKINDAILTQPVLGRMLNYGDLEILTAADSANDLYHMLNSPKEFKKTMLTQKHNLETEFMYGRPPSPPLRATVEGQPRPPEPMPAPPQPTMSTEPTPTSAPLSAAPAAAADEDEESVRVTETLARLADLRDEGAISAEEYEQKKDELLGRL